jgi:hypothetical protein
MVFEAFHEILRANLGGTPAEAKAAKSLYHAIAARGMKHMPIRTHGGVQVIMDCLAAAGALGLSQDEAMAHATKAVGPGQVRELLHAMAGMRVICRVGMADVRYVAATPAGARLWAMGAIDRTHVQVCRPRPAVAMPTIADSLCIVYNTATGAGRGLAEDAHAQPMAESGWLPERGIGQCAPVRCAGAHHGRPWSSRGME